MPTTNKIKYESGIKWSVVSDSDLCSAPKCQNVLLLVFSRIRPHIALIMSACSVWAATSISIQVI